VERSAIPSRWGTTIVRVAAVGDARSAAVVVAVKAAVPAVASAAVAGAAVVRAVAVKALAVKVLAAKVLAARVAVARSVARSGAKAGAKARASKRAASGVPRDARSAVAVKSGPAVTIAGVVVSVVAAASLAVVAPRSAIAVLSVAVAANPVAVDRRDASAAASASSRIVRAPMPAEWPAMGSRPFGTPDPGADLPRAMTRVARDAAVVAAAAAPAGGVMTSARDRFQKEQRP